MLTIIGLALIFLCAGFLLSYYFKALKQRHWLDSEDNEAVFERNCVIYGLSARETQIARLVLEGKTYSQISDLLYISKKTVNSHIQNIHGKVGVKNKIELLRKLYRD